MKNELKKSLTSLKEKKKGLKRSTKITITNSELRRFQSKILKVTKTLQCQGRFKLGAAKYKTKFKLVGNLCNQTEKS